MTYAGMGISNLISLIYTPLMLNILGQKEYGLYQLVFSVVSYLGLLSFGFHNAYLRKNKRNGRGGCLFRWRSAESVFCKLLYSGFIRFSAQSEQDGQ